MTAGFLLAAAVGVPLGLWMGSFKVVEAVVQPIIEFVRYIPVPALIPILMVLFGIDELSKIMLIWVGTFFQLVLMVADEVRRVPDDLLQVSYTLGARRGEVIRRVLWPAARPGIFDALRLCNGWAWTYVVVAELVAANEGLGYRILKFSRFLQTPQMWVYVILLGLIGLALDAAFRAAQPAPLPLGGDGAMRLDVRGLAKTYAGRQGEVVALTPTSFSVGGGEFVSLLGPSGCGKSTTLSIIAGLDDATAGEVLLDDVRVNGPGPERGMVFQSYTLFPWLTVEENTRFALGLAANARRTGANGEDAAARGRAAGGHGARPTSAAPTRAS